MDERYCAPKVSYRNYRKNETVKIGCSLRASFSSVSFVSASLSLVFAVVGSLLFCDSPPGPPGHADTDHNKLGLSVFTHDLTTVAMFGKSAGGKQTALTTSVLPSSCALTSHALTRDDNLFAVCLL